MNIFLDAHRTVLQMLIKKGVDFMLIGGYAVNYYGYNRTTADMDVWLNPNNENKQALLKTLSALDFDSEGIAIIEKWNFEEPQKFHVFKKPFQTEFMTHISGVQYKDAKTVAVSAIVDGLALSIIHLNTLIINKRATGRTKDLADAEYLEKIIDLKKKRP